MGVASAIEQLSDKRELLLIFSHFEVTAAQPQLLHLGDVPAISHTAFTPVITAAMPQLSYLEGVPAISQLSHL